MNEQSSTCDGCYWKDSCDGSSPCEYYYTPGMEDDDTVIQLFTKKERDKFRREWNRYIREYE